MNKIYFTSFVIAASFIAMMVPVQQANAQVAGLASCAAGSFIGARVGAALGALGSGMNVPTNDTQNNQKESLLDALAFCAAKQILHQMTIATVNWINSGFDGSPAFLSDPEGFFLDAADQLTGDFISQSGPLSSLCSPWSVDVRLKLALGQYQGSGRTSGYYRYGCTLSTIIDNAENATINGFIGGDFNQGGWPAFIAMTTDPRNNPYGSYLRAQADLNQQLADRKTAINQDLDRGNGFLSWKQCRQVPVTDVGSDDTVGGTYESCTVETPGSVIADTLNKQLGTTQDELVNADEMNEIVSALITQLANRLLGSGLRSLSPGGTNYRTGGQPAYFTQLQDEIAAENRAAGQTLYEQAITLVADSRNRLETARSCIVSEIASAYGTNPVQVAEAQLRVTAIESTINTRVVPLITALTTAQRNATSESQGTQALIDSQTQTTAFNQEAQTYQSYCDSLDLNIN